MTLQVYAVESGNVAKVRTIKLYGMSDKARVGDVILDFVIWRCDVLQVCKIRWSRVALGIDDGTLKRTAGARSSQLARFIVS